MIKRFLVMSLVVAGLSVAIFYWAGGLTTTTLAETLSIKENKEAFILHMRIENSEQGFRVLHSLEYTGDEQVTIEHRTPLTSISIDARQSDFTGSTTSKTLHPGDFYRPDNTPASYDSLEAGHHDVYIHCQFFIEGEPVDIEIEKEIVFN
ncbi:hypothetical protein GCM10011351_02350 [Paraliobacillus quinghaiensis]|uniref:Uncharacterized protein n=1 Tax=Paraliobacillus quinghaiensis TaxID=470815 RepID=A0A917TE32_9BACI|nr:hypothetical protein [Paraliobacillus quinghaiensis]GGM20043.1 hypothetical protein GCM10011351_02350 [Paraliobacillus quinghaiensis]